MTTRLRATKGGAVCPRCHGTGRELDHRAIGADMRARRERARLSLRDMSRKLMLTASYLCDLELGRRAWSVDKIKAYREATS